MGRAGLSLAFDFLKARTRRQELAARRIMALVDSMEPRIRRRFLEAIEKIRSAMVLEETASLLANGRVAEALAAVSQGLGSFATEATATTFILAEQGAAETLGEELRVAIDFDLTNERAVRRMRSSRLGLIREFTEEQTRATRVALVEGMNRGLNPIDQARLFRDSIGLTERQMRAVVNFRRLLEEGRAEALTRALRDRRFDPTVLRTVRGERVLTAEEVDRMVGRYRERYIKYRSEVIARTEALRAVHEGEEELYRQAIDSGRVAAEDMTRTWITAHDEKVRGSHAAMDGQVRPFGEPFVSGNGYKLRYPGDPDAPASETVECRCALTTRLAGG